MEPSPGENAIVLELVIAPAPEALALLMAPICVNRPVVVSSVPSVGNMPGLTQTSLLAAPSSNIE